MDELERSFHVYCTTPPTILSSPTLGVRKMRLTGSAVDEVNFGIPFSSGALIPKHVKQIGPAWALFLHYEDRVTTGKGTTGHVLGLTEITDEEPSRLGLDVATIGRHRRRLEKFGYISTKRGKKGFQIKVRKSKKWILIQVSQGRTAVGQGKSAVPTGKVAVVHDRNARSKGLQPIYDQSKTKQGLLGSKEFQAFYEAYPKKENRPAALRAWKKQNIKPAEVPAIMASIEAHRDTDKWTKQKRQFCPYPASFLNARTWEDEPPEVNNGPGTGKPNGGGKFAAYNHTAASLRGQ